MELSKIYNPKESEEKIYEMWEKGGYFTAQPSPAKKSFCIIMPPPNANGALHIGHALFVTLQDIMIRYHRMKGDCALWLPGADHAGFETQVVFDKKLEKENRRKNEIPPEQLYQEMMDFTLANKKIMEGQLKKLGASCDWTREKFTLDKDIVKIVLQNFEKLKQDGLVYKGSRLVNWCIKHQTSLSDLEVKYEERVDNLYFIKYPIKNIKSKISNPKGDFIVVATTRPETMLGDTAVAVNPMDKRYKKLIGQKVILPLVNREIPIISDKSVDKKFGTGAVKVTPAHDFADFEVWQNHKAEMEMPLIIIDKYGRMNEKAGKYQSLKISEAREKIIEDLKIQGLLEKIQNEYKHNVAVCYKCGTVIEPTLMDNQWFVKMTEPPAGGGLSLRDLAVKAIKNKEIEFTPARFEKIFLQWMENLRDWNISRQIPWGIPIPEDENGQVFDTWFSSGQWPFATLLASGCSKSKIKNQKSKLRSGLDYTTDDFEYFYPTSVMETGADILFFWVARMVMLGIYVTDKVPFKDVYLHGLVRDKDRQKMSKSKGNVIDPLGVIDLHGTDALRMALVFANSPGQDIAFSEDKIIAQRRFANKIWNAARFVLTQEGQNGHNPAFAKPSTGKQNPKTKADKEILEKLQKTIKSTTKDIENFQFHEAAQTLYHFFWHTFCDQYIEQAKIQISKPTPQCRPEIAAATEGSKTPNENTINILLYVLRESLKLLHPFMPFITEQIYQMLPNKEKETLIIENWPK